jgi:hypothetical protein
MRFCCRAGAVEEPSALRWFFYRYDSRAMRDRERPDQVHESTAPLLLCFLCGARRSRQLQHGCVLTFAQPGKLHDLTIGELQDVMMHAGLLQVDPLKSSYLRTDQFLAPDDIKTCSHSTSCANATSVPGRRHTAAVGSSTAANRPVREFLNLVVTSLSPTFAGRDATKSRL